MRILVLCSDTGVRIGDRKGASLHLRAITHAFAALGHVVEVVGIAASDPAGVNGWKMPVHVVSHPGRSEGLERERRKLVATRAVTRRAREVAARFGPDIVYERLSLFGTAGLRVVADTGACHVLEVNALLTAEETAWRGLHLAELARTVEAEVLASADLRVAVSGEVLDLIAPDSAGGLSIVVPNGVDTDLFASRPDRGRSRAAFGLPPDATLLGFTGSIRPWHGLDLAIDALSALPDRVHLVVAGDGPIRADLARQAGVSGAGHRLHWLGQLPHERVPEMLAACDIALAPYPQLPNFGFSPLKLHEYLAAGVPVIASDIGQIRQTLEGGRFGRLVAPGNATALASAISAELADMRTARNRADHARAHALSRHGWTERAAAILAAASTPAAMRQVPARVEALRAMAR